VRSLAVIGALIAVSLLAACGSGSGASTVEEKSATQLAKERDGRLAMPKAETEGLPPLVLDAHYGPEPKEVVVKDIRKGSGAVMKGGDDVVVNFVGIRYDEPFGPAPAADYGPMRFPFGQINQGWKKGLPGMRVGGRRELIVPPDPPAYDETTVYLVDLIAIEPPNLAGPTGNPQPVREAQPKEPPRKGRLAMSKAEIAKLPQFTIEARHGSEPKNLVIKDLRDGSGAVMRRGDAIRVLFAGVRFGEHIHTTPATRNAPTEFTFDEIIKGWQKGLPGMRVGGRRELVVPPRLAYRGGDIIYVVDLLAIKP
jgi:peptidylprolyl isomerase